jgi:tetratricopeptide (TPR) repeat protein
MVFAMKRFVSLLPTVAALALAFFVVQSGTREDFFIVGNAEQKTSLRSLFQLLSRESQPGATRFTLLHEITQRLAAQGEVARINLLLTTYTAQNPTDPFGAHYLFEVAENYRAAGALPMARAYYRRILRTMPDLVENEESIHYLCLLNLIPLETEPSAKRAVFEELNARFRYKMTSPELFYAWGRASEALGHWDEAQTAYFAFLKFPDPTVPGEPKAASRVHALVDLAQTDRSWIRQDLNDLMAQLRRSILTNDTITMENLRAKVGFFAVSWDNTDIVDTASEAFDVRLFLRSLVRDANYGSGTEVRFSDKLDEASNEGEAYLRSTGWNYRIPTWYFYFRRVEYPADPDINGAWEWAGVFFGEKL